MGTANLAVMAQSVYFENRGQRKKMEDEKKETLEKAKKRMELMNKVRLFFMFVAIVLLLFIFWGGKVWEEAQWFVDIRKKLYNFLCYDIILLVMSTFAKLLAAIRYNRAVRKLSS